MECWGAVLVAALPRSSEPFPSCMLSFDVDHSVLWPAKQKGASRSDAAAATTINQHTIDQSSIALLSWYLVSTDRKRDGTHHVVFCIWYGIRIRFFTKKQYRNKKIKIRKNWKTKNNSMLLRKTKSQRAQEKIPVIRLRTFLTNYLGEAATVVRASTGQNWRRRYNLTAQHVFSRQFYVMRHCATKNHDGKLGPPANYSSFLCLV